MILTDTRPPSPDYETPRLNVALGSFLLEKMALVRCRLKTARGVLSGYLGVAGEVRHDPGLRRPAGYAGLRERPVVCGGKGQRQSDYRFRPRRPQPRGG